MIYENYNRPGLIRLLEHATGARTQGIMQAQGVGNDEESIASAAQELQAYYARFQEQSDKDWIVARQHLEAGLRVRNPQDYTYANRVMEIFDFVQGQPPMFAPKSYYGGPDPQK